MIVCDRCLEKKYSKIEVRFEKIQVGPKAILMLAIPMELCEACISDLLKEFGKFKVAFVKQGDAEEKEGV